MVYHEIKRRGGKKYNYIVSTVRQDGKWKKLRKYVGEGDISANIIEREKKEFKRDNRLLYLTPQQAEEIENIRRKFDAYLKKGGKSGIQNFKEWFFTELTYNSNAIEGTSLSKRDTSLIINEGIVPKNASLREVNEAKNHKAALDFLLEYDGDINEKLILKIHSIILGNMDNQNAGTYRKVPVFIYGFDIKFPHFSEVPRLIK